jgi:nucleolar protein 16
VAPSKRSTVRKLAISSIIPTVLAPTSARVERDPESGKILRVIHEQSKKPNPLNDLLNSDDEDESQDEEMGEADEFQEQGKEIISQLEEQARMVPEKKVRKQSQREKEWIERLVRAYGDDFTRMARDRKLNPMQQTEADISRRVKKWRAEGGTVEVES